MTTAQDPDFDPIKAAAECMQWPTIAEAVRNYHNDNGSADSVFKLIHDDYRLGEAAQIVDVLLKRGKYAEDTPAAPVIPQPLAEIDALKKQIKNLEWTLRQIVTYTPDTEPDAMSEAYSAWTIRQIAELALGVHSAVQS